MKYAALKIFNLFLIFLITYSLALKAGTLSSWNEPYKSTFTNYIKKITAKNTKGFVLIEDRVAVFDLDGTLIAEGPKTLEEILTNTRLLEKLEKDPTLIANPNYKAVKEKDTKYFRDQNHVLEKIAEAFAGEKMNFYLNYLKDFVFNHKNEKFNVPYSALAYTPMLELIDYLKQNNFKVYICSGTQEELLKILAPALHIDRDKMIGTIIGFEFVEELSISYFRMLNKVVLPSANEENKPVRIFERIGKRPIIAIANSYKDRFMLKYTADSKYPNLVMVLDHDDEREVIDKREDILKHSKEQGWAVISMKKGFKKIFAQY